MGGLFYRFLAAREAKRALSASLSEPLPAIPVIVEHNARQTVWEVRADQSSRHYLRLLHRTADEYVVYVHAERFYGAWLLCSTVAHPRGDACAPRRLMPKDYKYQRAVEGFSRGLPSPVPLAEVSAMERHKGIQIMFANGVTRTFWLLHNRCPSFPILVQGMEAAKLINERMGLLSGPIPTTEIAGLQRFSASSSLGGQHLSKPAWLG